MNDHMIDSWNKVVTPEDEIYHLGDFSFKATKRGARAILRKLNGKKYFIKGNHDRSDYLNNLKNAGLIEWWDYNHILQHEHNGKVYTFSLSHYPHFPTKESDIICLFGHIHGRNIEIPHGIGIDVGVDNLGYEPISITTIIDYVERQKNKPTLNVIEKHDKINKLFEENKEISPELTKNFVTFPLVENPYEKLDS